MNLSALPPKVYVVLPCPDGVGPDPMLHYLLQRYHITLSDLHEGALRLWEPIHESDPCERDARLAHYFRHFLVVEPSYTHYTLACRMLHKLLARIQTQWEAVIESIAGRDSLQRGYRLAFQKALPGSVVVMMNFNEDEHEAISPIPDRPAD